MLSIKYDHTPHFPPNLNLTIPNLRTIHPLPLIILLRNLQHREFRRHNPPRRRSGNHSVLGEIGDTAFLTEKVLVGIEESVYRGSWGAEHSEDCVGEDFLQDGLGNWN